MHTFFLIITYASSLTTITSSFSPLIQTTKKLFHPSSSSSNNHAHHHLQMSLKPAAIPLLDSGKALARGGELLIDSTSNLGLYGGGLSSAGASLRNAGDCIAQAAASCRFKTGYELVIDEMREAASCLEEASGKLKRAVEEAEVDGGRSGDEKGAISKDFSKLVEANIIPTTKSAIALEAAGAGIMQRIPITEVGTKLTECGSNLVDLSVTLRHLAQNSRGDNDENKEEETMRVSSERILVAGEKMKEAGHKLSGVPTEKPKGKSWLKGGGL